MHAAFPAALLRRPSRNTPTGHRIGRGYRGGDSTITATGRRQMAYGFGKKRDCGVILVKRARDEAFCFSPSGFTTTGFDCRVSKLWYNVSEEGEGEMPSVTDKVCRDLLQLRSRPDSMAARKARHLPRHNASRL